MRKQLQTALKSGLRRPLSRKLDLRSARDFYEELNIELPRLLLQADFRSFHRRLSEQSRKAFRTWHRASQKTLAHRLHKSTLEGLLSNGWREDIQLARDSASSRLKVAEFVDGELHRSYIRRNQAEHVALELYSLYASDRSEGDYARLNSVISEARQKIHFIDSYYPAVLDPSDDWLYSDLRPAEVSEVSESPAERKPKPAES